MSHKTALPQQHKRYTSRSWSRRRVLALVLSGAGLTTLAACRPVQPPSTAMSATPAVTHTPSTTPVAAEPPTPTAQSTTAPATPTSVPTPAGPPVPVDIQLFSFQPATLVIAPNTTVVWTNRDDIEHSVTSGIPDAPDGLFDSGLFVLDDQFTFTFTGPGEYAYYCTRHPHMVGTVTVHDEASA